MTADFARTLPELPPLDAIAHVHVIGICGTAMGTLAAMLAQTGRSVSGSDAMAYPPMSTWLEARGLVIQSGYAPSHIPAETDLVVVGNVSRRDNPEALEALRRNLPFVSLPEALRVFFFPGEKVLAVTGTHGKTTTSSMAAWILHETGNDPSFFIGGVTGNFQSNFRLGRGGYFVIEGDEYDTAYFDKVPKFWHYPAVAATMNNVEFDHADIYPDIESVEHVFRRFAAQIPSEGTLWVNGDDPRAMKCAEAATASVRTFGLSKTNDLWGEVLRYSDDGVVARVGEREGQPYELTLPMVGEFNLRNFLGAAGLAMRAGVTLREATEAIRTFKGVVKRQEIKGVADGVTVVDDFAHHPSAVRETLEALRRRYPDQKLWAVFEAKSNTSRRAVFQQDYPLAFLAADHVVLTQPWRQDALPEDQKISIPKMVDDIRAHGVPVDLIADVPAIVDFLAENVRPGDVVAGLSGSSFDGLHGRLLDALRARSA